MTDEPKKPELTGDELLQKLFDELPRPSWITAKIAKGKTLFDMDEIE